MCQEIRRDPKTPGKVLRRHIVVLHQIDNPKASRVTEGGMHTCPAYPLSRRLRSH